MENNELLYLCMVAFTCYGFNLAQGLRAAINRGDTVRITPKILCFVFCISVSIIAINIIKLIIEFLFICELKVPHLG